MHFHSITVRNYRILGELHVKLDRSLTLVGGPNETGKSTLVEAAHRALFLRARTSGESIRGMASLRHPGHPEVEVEFEVGGRIFQIAKRFSGGSGTATLIEKEGTTYRGDEAEAKLAELLNVDATGGGRGAGGRAAQQWAHLWIWQGQAGDDPTVHATTQKDALLARLQVQGGGAAMQSVLDTRVADRVAKKQAEWFNQNGTPKRDSPLGRAMRDLEAAQAEFQTAQATLERLQQAVVDSQEADRLIADCEQNLDRFKDEIRKLDEQLNLVQSLRRAEQRQEPEAKSAASQHDVRLQADGKIRHLRNELQTRTAALAPRQAETQRLLAEQQERGLQARQAEADYQAAVDLTSSARLRQELATAFVAFFEKTAQRDQLLSKQNQVADVRVRLQKREAELARLPLISASQLNRLQQLLNRVSSAEAALQAMAAGIEVLVSDQTVRVERKILEVGASQILTEETDVLIGETTRLRIKPGGGISLQSARSHVVETRRALQQELDLLGVSSTAEAAEVNATQQQLNADIKADKAQLAGLGANTIDEDFAAAKHALLKAEAEVQQRSHAVSDFTAPANATEAQDLKRQTGTQQREAELEESRRKSIRDAAVVAQQTAIDTLAEHEQTLLQENHALTGLQAQLRLLEETHGQDEERVQRLTEALANKVQAETLLAQTRQSLAALQPAMLEQDQARLQRAVTQCQATFNEAMSRRAVARSLLQSNGSSDPQATLALAEAHQRSLSEQHESLDKDARATQLLHQLFLEEKRALSEQFTRPFVDRINGYLQCIFGAQVRANVRLEEDRFGGLDLVRPDRGLGQVAFDSLSAGTREQLAAAVRLAMAEVLAEDHDRCLPVVFDDAFTNSDPERIATLQRMLDRAANRGLQIIILSCTPSDYASLGAQTMLLRADGFAGRQPSAVPEDALRPAPVSALEGEDTDRSELTVNETHREQLIAALRSAGGSQGNNSLRQTLNWDESFYNAVKDSLVASGDLIPGRGRGGSVSLAE